MRRLRVLLACEMSARVRDEFAKLGWEAVSADLMPCEGDPEGIHYQGDVLDLFKWEHPLNSGRLNDWLDLDRDYIGPHVPYPPLWDLIIAFPPCTDLSYAGNRWRAEKRADGREDAAAKFFMRMIDAPSPLVAVENPRGVMFTRFRKPDQVIQPYYFGDPFRKTTCFWLKGLPHLVRTDECEPQSTVTSGDMKGYRFGAVVTQGSNYQARFGNGASHYEDSQGRARRSIVRSLTFPGVARAMAGQWGGYAEGYYLERTS